MAMPRKLLHVSMIVDQSIIYDLMSLADGKSFEVEIRPVKNGGTKENGDLKPLPTGIQFVAAYASEHLQFKAKEIIKAAGAAGLNKGSIYAALSALKGTGVLKAGSGFAEYKVVGKPERVAAAAASSEKNKRGKHSKRSKPGERNKDHIMKVMKQHNGHDVTLKALKAALIKAGKAITGISPTLTSMVNKKEIVRVREGIYRAAPAAQEASPAN